MRFSSYVPFQGPRFLLCFFPSHHRISFLCSCLVSRMQNKLPTKNVEMFAYLGTTLTSRYCIHNAMTSILYSENACYHWVQNRLCSSVLSKNIELKMYRNYSYICCLGVKLGRNIRGLFKKYPDWNCSGCSLGGMCLQPVLTCSYMS